MNLLKDKQKLEDLKVEYDKLQEIYGAKELDSIYNGGCTENPDICFVFMNPTGKNIASNKEWTGRKSPWLGTKNIWKLFNRVNLLSDDTYNKILEKRPKDWDYQFCDYVYDEISMIASQGIKEVVITGIHVASYGKDFKNGFELIDLLEKIHDIPGIERIRLGSIEPLWMTKEVIDRLNKLDKICHQFHLSLQSGCDDTLKRMNRRYTTNQFEEIVNNIRHTFDDAILTTDIIVGFAGETDEEFEQTYYFLKKINFYKMHIFKYSPRKGTKAENMPNQVDGNIKELRSKKLIELSDLNEINYLKSYIGKTISVLWEEEKNGVIKGHTPNYLLAEIGVSDELLKNSIINTINDVIVVDVNEAELALICQLNNS